MTPLIRFALPVPLVVLIIAGCTGSSKTPCTVSGKVTYKGQPVTGGSIAFNPTSEDQQGMYGYDIKPDGTYEGTSSLPVGEYIVVIDTESLNPNKAKQDAGGMGGKNEKMQQMYREKMKQMGKGGNPPQGTYVQIPKKYSDKKTSDLKAKLTSGKNVKDFELTD